MRYVHASSVAQWKSGGLITPRSVDRNHALLVEGTIKKMLGRLLYRSCVTFACKQCSLVEEWGVYNFIETT